MTASLYNSNSALPYQKNTWKKIYYKAKILEKWQHSWKDLVASVSVFYWYTKWFGNPSRKD